MYCRTPNVVVITRQILAIIKKGEIVERGSYFNLYEDGFDDAYQFRISPVFVGLCIRVLE